MKIGVKSEKIKIDKNFPSRTACDKQFLENELYFLMTALELKEFSSLLKIK